MNFCECCNCARFSLGTCEAPSALAGEPAACISSDAEVGLIALTDCCRNLRDKCSFVGQICMKLVSFTPDLGGRVPLHHGPRGRAPHDQTAFGVIIFVTGGPVRPNVPGATPIVRLLVQLRISRQILPLRLAHGGLGRLCTNICEH